MGDIFQLPTARRSGQSHIPPIRRREALSTLALAAGGVALSSVAGLARQMAASRGPVIRTLLKDVPPGAIQGATLFHEHLSMRFPLGSPTHFTDDVAMMVEEARGALSDGIGCIVDGGHADMQRNLEALRRVAGESGLLLVASGGYYMQRTYPAELAAKSADDIARELADEATRERFGAFGEIGQQGGVMTADEKKVFEAVAKAQVRTGLPIFTHNAYLGTRPGAADIPRETALRQLDVLEAAGASAAHVAIGHLCCHDDPKAEIPIAIARRGAYVGFDRVTIQLVPDAQKVTTVLALVEAGHGDKLLLSSDFSNARGLKRNGGAGLAQTSTVFGPMLVKAGLGEDVLRRILVENPKRFLAFVPHA
jgi:phosphotriesterase-related protein